MNFQNSDLALSDGTPVEFVKETSKGNIQVRIPEGHTLASDPLRIFRPDGSHYKDELSLTLVVTPRHDPVPAPAPALADTVDPTTDDVFQVGDSEVAFTSLDDAKREAFDQYLMTGQPVEITQVKVVVVGVIGF